MKTEPVRPDVSRRAFFGTALGSAAAAGLSLSFPKAASARAALPAHGLANLIDDESAPEQLLSSLKGAFSFLDTMMDAYASGPTIRLIQSYSDALFAPFSPVAFTYDNAVAIQAYLARGTSDDLQRAQILGNGLIVAQATNFPINDGRFAQAYYVNVPNSSGAFITPAAFPFFFYSSSVGDQAWTGMALAQLYKHTRNAAYLNAAVNVANWIVTNTYDTAGAGGYRFGTNINPSNQSVPSTNGKSTEHNIDTYAFFNMLASLTHGGVASNGSSWSSLAQHALVFVEAMFNSTGGFFYTGTDSDQITIATGNIPEDVQTWSYLALLNKTYGVSIDWVKTNLATLDTPSCPLSALKANICVLARGHRAYCIRHARPPPLAARRHRLVSRRRPHRIQPAAKYCPGPSQSRWRANRQRPRHPARRRRHRLHRQSRYGLRLQLFSRPAYRRHRLVRPGPAGQESIPTFLVNRVPECVVSEFPKTKWRTVSFKTMANFVREFGNAVHENTNAPVTLGGADPFYMRNWADAKVGIDIYQAHSYPKKKLVKENAAHTARTSHNPVWT
jgi:hypothetical protein